MDKNELNEDDVLETQEDTETTEATQDEETSQKDETETVDFWKRKAEEYQGRLKRAETKLDKSKSTENTQPSGVLSSTDIITLAKADVDEDSIPDILEYAKFKKISVAEAIKSSFVKNIIAEKREFKRSKEVINTGSQRTTTLKVTDEQILAKAKSGKDLSEDEFRRLANM